MLISEYLKELVLVADQGSTSMDISHLLQSIRGLNSLTIAIGHITEAESDRTLLRALGSLTRLCSFAANKPSASHLPLLLRSLSPLPLLASLRITSFIELPRGTAELAKDFDSVAKGFPSLKHIHWAPDISTFQLLLSKVTSTRVSSVLLDSHYCAAGSEIRQALDRLSSAHASTLTHFHYSFMCMPPDVTSSDPRFALLFATFTPILSCFNLTELWITGKPLQITVSEISDIASSLAHLETLWLVNGARHMFSGTIYPYLMDLRPLAYLASLSVLGITVQGAMDEFRCLDALAAWPDPISKLRRLTICPCEDIRQNQTGLAANLLSRMFPSLGEILFMQGKESSTAGWETAKEMYINRGSLNV